MRIRLCPKFQKVFAHWEGEAPVEDPPRRAEPFVTCFWLGRSLALPFKNLFMSLVALALMGTVSTARPSAPDPPVELGRVHWGRDYEAAIEQSRRSRKPIMVLFDEIPGCATCRNFGTGPLSHPIVIEASREFVTLAIYNNRPGTDQQILRRFNEPAWNNPVVRFLDSSGRDIIPRRDRIWSTAGLLNRMVQALEAAQRPVPTYLSLVASEYSPKDPQIATFGMYCYWEGEKRLGAINGILGTRIGVLGGREVVEVKFDAAVIDYRTLLETAQQQKCTSPVFARNQTQAQIAKQVVGDQSIRQSNKNVNKNTQQQYHLFHNPPYHFLPLTALQATKVNAALASRLDPNPYLSPGQQALRIRIKNLLAKDHRLVDELDHFKPDRSESGLPHYAQRIEQRVTQLATDASAKN